MVKQQREHVYTLRAPVKVDEGLGEQRPLSGVEEYLAAQQKHRERLTALKA